MVRLYCMAMSDDLWMVGETGELMGKTIKTGGYGCGRLQEMSDEFIGEALEFCIDEVGKLHRGEAGIDMIQYARTR